MSSRFGTEPVGRGPEARQRRFLRAVWTAAPGVSQTATVMVCATCGESNAEGARFCQACGYRLGEAPPRSRKTITSLFCDLAGSTTLAGSLADPEAVHDVLTRYLRAMTTAVLADRHWSATTRLVPLAPDPETIRSFLAGSQRCTPASWGDG